MIIKDLFLENNGSDEHKIKPNPDSRKNLLFICEIQKIIALICCEELRASVNEPYHRMVPGAGIEPARLFRPRDFKSLVSTNFTIRA